MSHEVVKRSKYFLEPGYIYCASEPASVHTVVGSCVAVCVWDRRLHIGGINHFLYPGTSERSEATACYGNVATMALLGMMEEAGCRRHNLLAQILGGAARMTHPGESLGRENVEAARAVLRKRRVTICSEDVGGNMGRKIVFDTVTGHVGVLKVFDLRKEDWITDVR